MTTSTRKANGSRNLRVWLRRGHRWLGLAAVLFVLLLSVTGFALNHSSDWQLDRRYVTWPWLVSALGIRAPDPSGSFADRRHRATQLGRRAYLDTHEIPAEVDALRGLVVQEPYAVVATPTAALLMTVDGDLIERIDLTADLAGPVQRIGRAKGRTVLEAGGEYYVADSEVTAFLPWQEANDAEVSWSTASDPAPVELAAVQDLYRGRGLTVERLLIEIHSGRIIRAAGPLVLDIVAVGLIILSLSGFVVWLRGYGRLNGNGNGNRQR